MTTDAENQNNLTDHRQRDMAQALQELTEAEAQQDGVRSNLAKMRIEFLEERERLKAAEEVKDQENLAALKFLLQAVDMGIGLLVLGTELGLYEDLFDEQEHWMPMLSNIHQGIWEYFWAQPDGVFDYA